MTSEVSFTHLLNPFLANAKSEHAIASKLTWQTLRIADSEAKKHDILVECKAVILPRDRDAVELPATATAYLSRTVQDVADLHPKRPLPMMGDILRIGSQDIKTTHVIYSNMDIAVQPHFYISLRDLIQSDLGFDTPFTIARINVDPSLATAPIEELFSAKGTLGHGYDCFVIPCKMIDQIDLGKCCIGAPHFDQLLLMSLDLISGHRVRTLNDTRLTIHLGNDIAWAAMIDYVEHNLAESLAAIERMKESRLIQAGNIFDHLDRRHFKRNATLISFMLRKIRRIPLISNVILLIKRLLGRQY